MPKFDVVVGNPPYQRGLHMKFLDIACKTSTKYVVFIQPSIWILSGIKSQYSKILTKLKKKFISIDLINGNTLFNVALTIPLSVVLIDTNKDSDNFIIHDKIKGYKSEISDPYKINIWGNYNIFPTLKEKIEKLAEINNCKNTLSYKNKNANWFITMCKIKGHVEMNRHDKFITSDFFAPFPKDYLNLGYKPIPYLDKDWISGRGRNWYGFDTEIEAYNYISFMKTRFAMFCLSLNKFNMNIQEKEVEGIPCPDFTQQWTDEKLYKHFNLSQEEIDFIETNIPNYYNE